MDIVDHSVRAFILNQSNQVLLTMRQDMPFWLMPGGGVDPGEDAKDAMFRELSEELQGLEVLFSYKIGNYDKIMETGLARCEAFAFTCTINSETKIIQPPDEEIYWEFFDQNSLPLNIYPPMWQRIKDGYAGERNISKTYNTNTIQEIEKLRIVDYYKLDEWLKHPAVLRNKENGIMRHWPLKDE